LYTPPVKPWELVGPEDSDRKRSCLGLDQRLGLSRNKVAVPEGAAGTPPYRVKGTCSTYPTSLFYLSTMLRSPQRVVVVLPAYNSSKTLTLTYQDIPQSWIDDIILVDDGSQDNTVAIAQQLGIQYIIQHIHNKGYGANQKSCYKKALEIGADIVIMLHPDYQYTPKLIPAMVALIDQDLYEVVLGSRILGKGALAGGMPLYKYIANRFLTFFQNIFLNEKLSEYHTGYRAFSRQVLEQINFEANSDDFIFDNEMLSQIIYKKMRIAEITCPTKYFKEASSISFSKSIQYGLGVLLVTGKYLLAKWNIYQAKIYR
jgi:glycosyltransferase involved in cell wall biosynthesis